MKENKERKKERKEEEGGRKKKVRGDIPTKLSRLVFL